MLIDGVHHDIMVDMLHELNYCELLGSTAISRHAFCCRHPQNHGSEESRRRGIIRALDSMGPHLQTRQTFPNLEANNFFF